jgi:short subunit dehydrogenase-like uncharacterized protein
MSRKSLDVTIVGCTGFTGRLVAQYFASTVAKRLPSLRWALAGRDASKLAALADSLPSSPSETIIASLSEGDAERIAEPSRVILSTAGPFALYGTPLIRACIKHGASYTDINGEIGWHHSMINEYDQAAREAGITLVPSAGFDSIPSDLGAQWMAERLGGNASKIRCYASLRGGFSGGTVASGINSEKQHGSLLSDPFLLGGSRAGGPRQEDCDPPYEAKLDPHIGKHVAPFGMAVINSRIVRRTAGLLEARGFAHPSVRLYARDFAYSEVAMAPDEETAVKMARAASVPASKLQELVAQGRLPAPGDGPSEAERAKNWFRFHFLAESSEPGIPKLAGTVSGGDPGYTETAKMVSESAVMLATDGPDSEAIGFQTPASALGARLRARLHSEGISFEEAPLPSSV